MNAYEAKIEAKRERLELAAERAEAKAAAEFRKSDLSEAATGIPFGQPILVGHHSEGRHRRTIDRAWAALGRGVEASKRAGELAHRAETLGTHGISSDDPDAVAKLKEELAEKEARHARIKAGDHASYQLSNSSANIRRIKARIATLERNAGREHKETEHPSGVRVVENVEENRLQLIFPGKPDAETRTALKRAGFRWAPSEGAWQRQLNNAAKWSASGVLEKLATVA